MFVHLSIIIIQYYYYNDGGGLFTAFPKKMALHLLIKYIIVYLTDFWKTNLTKFAVIWLKTGVKRQVSYARERLQNHSNEGKGKEKKKERRRRSGKEEKKKKAMVALLVFIMSYFGYSFWSKKLLDGKGPFDDNVFKNPARYMQLNICYYIRSKKCSW